LVYVLGKVHAQLLLFLQVVQSQGAMMCRGRVKAAMVPNWVSEAHGLSTVFLLYMILIRVNPFDPLRSDPGAINTFDKPPMAGRFLHIKVNW
jgi:hypothetical protein